MVMVAPLPKAVTLGPLSTILCGLIVSVGKGFSCAWKNKAKSLCVGEGAPVELFNCIRHCNCLKNTKY